MQLYQYFHTLASWICLTVLIIVIFIWLRPWIRACRLAFSLPGPPALPFLGNIFFHKDEAKFVESRNTAYETYGPLVRAWLTLIPVVVVIEPKYIQAIVGSTKQNEKGFFYSFLNNFVGSGLVTNNGNEWKSHRKYIQPYFNVNVLKRYVESISEAAQALVKKLENEREIKANKFINYCILDILHQTILGIAVNDHETKSYSPFYKSPVLIITLILRPWNILKSMFTYSNVKEQEGEQKFTQLEFIRKILDERKEKEINQWCFLDALQEISRNHPDFTYDDVVNESRTFMLAGQDSASVAICYTLHHLAKHEDIQEKVVQELNTVFKQSCDINMETLSEMKYLEQCIKETLRLCPSIPIIMKKLTEDVKLDKHVLPAGLNILIMPGVTHMLEHYYPNPEKFDPDRFSTENQEKLDPFAYMPFSGGPRNCIASKFALLEMKIVISTMLWHYKISLVPGYDLQLSYRVTLRAKGGVPLRICPRQAN